jgi:hypothetical protein
MLGMLDFGRLCPLTVLTSHAHVSAVRPKHFFSLISYSPPGISITNQCAMQQWRLGCIQRAQHETITQGGGVDYSNEI